MELGLAGEAGAVQSRGCQPFPLPHPTVAQHELVLGATALPGRDSGNCTITEPLWLEKLSESVESNHSSSTATFSTNPCP